MYQRKHNADGTLNPFWKPDRRRGSRHRNRATGRAPGRPRTRDAALRKRRGFVAWDGEGVTVNGRHRFVMLLSSSGARAVNPAGLSTVDCLELLVEGGKANPRAWHVGFAFSYDSNMILGDLPRRAIRALWKGQQVDYRGYRIRYRPRKEFVVKRLADGARICVWDVFGFFQSSFVEALKQYEICNPSRIAEMKARRAVFSLDELADVEAYCREECAYLESLMERFQDYLTHTGLSISRYDGAGAVAGSLLRSRGVDAYRDRLPRRLTRAAQNAYYGGRIELLQFGHAPNTEVWQYDLRSAYPAAMQSAPCLKCGGWEWNRGGVVAAKEYGIYRVRWNFPRGWVLPFPWRAGDGHVYFPRTGEGWYWGSEVLAAREAMRRGVIVGELEIMERWEYLPACDHKPFSWVPEIYAQRREWRAAGIGAEKVLKLGLNSIYGKTAQRIGGRFGKPPRWHQIEWSGYVTARTRATLYRAALPAIATGAAVMFATDAIVSLMPLAHLQEGAELGEWECERHTGITAVQSGVYWLGEDTHPHTRGFRPDELDPKSVVAAWAAGEHTHTAPARRFVAMGRAVIGDASWAKWRQWVEEPRELNLFPNGTKRELLPGMVTRGRNRIRPELGLIRTLPADVTALQWDSPRSMAIALPWENRNNQFDPAASYEILNADNESDDGLE